MSSGSIVQSRASESILYVSDYETYVLVGIVRSVH